MPDPYGITQVDLPGVYGAVQNAHMGRVQAMLGERQIAAADRQAERDNAYNTALTRLFTPRPAPGASTGASGGSAPQQPPNPVAAAYGGVPPPSGTPAVTPQGLPGADPAGTPAPQVPQQIDINSPEAQALIQADPQRGMQTLHAISQMNADQIEQAHGRLAALAPYYANVAEIPYGTDGAQRRAYIQSILPQLQQMGLDPQQITGFDPTDQALNQHMRHGMTLDQVMTSQHRRLREVNGQLIDESALPQPTGGNPVVFTDPILNTGAGPYRRADVLGNGTPPPNLPHANTQEEALRLGPGAQFIGPDNLVHTVPGGPASAPGNFPRQDGGAFDFRANPTPGG